MMKKFETETITVSGTWELKKVANILRQHKKGVLSTPDAICELITQMKK